MELNFTTPHSSTNLTFSTYWEIGILEIWMLCFSVATGLPTHIYVIWLIVTGTGSSVASEFFNLNFSICEILFSVISLLILLTKWFPFQSLSSVVQFMFGFTVTGCPLFQCLICIERYLAVVHPVTFLKYKPLRYRVICCAVVWIYIVGTCLFCLFSFVSSHFFVYVWFYTLQFVLFLSIQLFCLVAVLRTLKKSGPGERKKEKEEENLMKRRAFQIIRVTTASLVVTYGPYIFNGLYSLVTYQNIQLIWSICYICFMLAGFVQPGLFLHRTGKLSMFFKKKVTVVF